jgi:hypothetical protein
VQGLKNPEVVVRSSPAILSAAPLTYFLGRDDLDFVVFCFASRDANTFCERFGFGSTWLRNERGDPNAAP